MTDNDKQDAGGGVAPRVYSERLKATIDGVEYEWVGGFGCVLTSYERGVKRGDVRMIGNIVFYAYQVSRIGWSREISWCPQHSISVDWLRQFKAAVFAT